MCNIFPFFILRKLSVKITLKKHSFSSFMTIVLQEMPKLIPTAAIRGGPHPSGSTNNNGGHADESEHDFLSHGSHSNETSLPLNEDPMNLVETSWDISTTLQVRLLEY